MIDWQRIDCVFLDMDGTLLDLHFDNHFWLEFVPKKYAKARGLSEEAARSDLLSRYADREGTLEWYCLDHWSRDLGLDIALLKEEVDHLIAVHPHVEPFLARLAGAGKRRVLVTNAHQKAIALKMDRTQLADCFDRIICAHEIGLPKEDVRFWARLHAIMPFDPERTLFIDDSLSVLRAAREYGIGQLLAITAPDSKQPLREVADFPALPNFESLLDDLNANR